MAKSTIAQEVSTGTAESFTDHEMSDPEPHWALLRNRPGLRDEPAQATELVVPAEDLPETEAELEEFDSELEEEPEEEESEAVKPPKKSIRRKSVQRITTKDYDFE